jgi:hypothetical protein
MAVVDVTLPPFGCPLAAGRMAADVANSPMDGESFCFPRERRPSFARGNSDDSER